MPTINLLPEQIGGEKIHEKKLPLDLLTTLFIITITLGTWLFLKVYNDGLLVKIESETKQSQNLLSQVENSENQKGVDFQKRLSNINQIIRGHLYWSGFFKFLEINTLSSVTFDSMGTNFNRDKLTFSVALSAKAPDYDIASQQAVIFFRNPYRVVVDGRVTDQIIWLDALDRAKVIIADANEPLDQDGYFKNSLVKAEIKNEIGSIESNKINYYSLPKIINSVDISGLAKAKDGKVEFNLDIDFNPNLLSFSMR